MEYTIELTNKQKKQMDLMCELFHRYVGFNPKLEMYIPIPMTVSPAYKKGFEDGKKQAIEEIPELANKENEIYNDGYNKALEDVDYAIHVLIGMTGKECAEWFEGRMGVYKVVCDYSIQRIVEITKAYEEKKKAEEEIKVGDVIYSEMTDSKAIIISFNAWDNWNCIDTCGTGFTIDDSKMEFWKKIGHIDEVLQVLDKLRGEEK